MKYTFQKKKWTFNSWPSLKWSTDRKKSELLIRDSVLSTAGKVYFPLSLLPSAEQIELYKMKYTIQILVPDPISSALGNVIFFIAFDRTDWKIQKHVYKKCIKIYLH